MTPTDTHNENSLGKQGNYPCLLTEIKERIRSAQYEALKAVNNELVSLYWDIGRMIVERQADAKHGSAIAEQLSSDLRAEFVGINEFSRRNIFYMRESYLLFRDDERVQPLVAQIGWTQNMVILQRCKVKNRTIVEYALHDARKPMGVATYEITRTLPKSLKGHLPTPKEIAHLLEDL